MAVWQYYLSLLPQAGLEKLFGTIPQTINFDETQESDLWKGVVFPDSLRKQIEILLPQEKSWSADTLQYGSLENNCIELCSDKNKIIECSARVDLRNPNNALLNLLLDCSKRHHFILYDREYGERIETSEKLAESIKKASSYFFVSDPNGFLTRLKKPNNNQN